MRATGTRGELLVAEKLIELGFHVSIPLDETQFDLVATSEEKSFRIQVKCTKSISRSCIKDRRDNRYHFNLGHGSTRKDRYTNKDCDYLVCLAMDSKRFWVFPVDDIKVNSVKIPAKGSSKYSKYEDRWDLIS